MVVVCWCTMGKVSYQYYRKGRGYFMTNILSSLDPPGSVLPCPSTPISWSSIAWRGPLVENMKPSHGTFIECSCVLVVHVDSVNVPEFSRHSDLFPQTHFGGLLQKRRPHGSDWRLYSLHMSDVTNQYIVRAKRVAETPYTSLRSALVITMQRQGWRVEQVSFVTGTQSLNEEELKKNLAYFKVPSTNV